jgi:hypothetical protein
VQPKLKIGSTNDQFEQEAEKISDQVVSEKTVNQKNTTPISKPKIPSNRTATTAL